MSGTNVALVGARFDHLVVSVTDLEAAMTRWQEAGLPAHPGGRHPGGTVNGIVRGPRAAYVELISTLDDADPEAPWVQRVRGDQGPLGFAIAVDDIGAARDAVISVGLSPGAVTEGSRETPDGTTLRWRMCQVGERPFDPELPFLIEWVTPMPAGPADGPVLESVSLEIGPSTHARDRLLAMLHAVGFPEVPGTVPWKTFSDGEVVITLPATDAEVQEWERSQGGSASYLRIGDPEVEEAAPEMLRIGQVGFGLPGGDGSWGELDGLSFATHPDVRSHVGHILLPAVETHFAARPADLVEWPHPHPGRDPLEEEYSRCLDPGKYQIIAARVRAWASALAEAGVADQVDHASGFDIVPRREGALPVTVTLTDFEGVEGNGVTLSVRDTALERLPDCGCDACDSGSADLLTQVDELLLHIVDGGVLQVGDGRGRVVQSTASGWSASGNFGREEPEQWLRDAREGRSRLTVVEGAPWL